MTLSYDGTDYCGWQIQPNGLTIQEVVEKALLQVTQQKVRLHGSGRTDSGVHALAQEAHFILNLSVDPKRLMLSLNGILPEDIRITKLSEATPDFHARFSAKGKIYHYHICLDQVRSPFAQRTSYHCRYQIDREKMQAAAAAFVGTHDFTSFANSPGQGAAARNAIRTIYRIDIVEEPGGVRLEFEGNGFLYKMVRTIVGTIIEVARGKRPVEDIPRILAARDRRQAGKLAPAKGLFLVKALY